MRSRRQQGGDLPCLCRRAIKLFKLKVKLLFHLLNLSRSVSFRFVLFRCGSFPFHMFRLDLFSFVSICFVPSRFCFILHSTGTRISDVTVMANQGVYLTLTWTTVDSGHTFFYRTFIINRVLTRLMPWQMLISPTAKWYPYCITIILNK